MESTAPHGLLWRKLTPSQPDPVQPPPLIPYHLCHALVPHYLIQLWSSHSYIVSFLYPTQTFLLPYLTHTALQYLILLSHTFLFPSHSISHSQNPLLPTLTTYTTYLNHLYIQQWGLYILIDHHPLSLRIYTEIIPPFHAPTPSNVHKNSQWLGPHLSRWSLRTGEIWGNGK